MPFKKKIREGEPEPDKYAYPITGLNNIKGYLCKLMKDINTPPSVVLAACDRLALYSAKDKETADKIEAMFFDKGKKIFKSIEDIEKPDPAAQNADDTLRFLEGRVNGIQS